MKITKYKIKIWLLTGILYSFSFLTLSNSIHLKLLGFVWFFVLTRVYVEHLIKEYGLNVLESQN